MLLTSKTNLIRMIRPLNSLLNRSCATMETTKKDITVPAEDVALMDMPLEEPLIKQKKQLADARNVKLPTELRRGLDVPFEEPINAYILTNQIGSNFRKWDAVLEKHPELLKIKRNDIIKSAKALEKLNFDANTILTKPMILYQNALTIENRYEVLTECGFESITLMILSKYVRVINKSVTFLKCNGYLPFETNLVENLCNCLTGVDLCAKSFDDLNDNMLVKQFRESILNAYLRKRLEINDDQIKKLWSTYSRVRHRSFKSIQAVLHILLDELHFPKERIIKNTYLLYADAENIRRIIKEIPTIDNQDIRDIVYRRPKILMSTCDALLKSLEYFKAYNISESAVTKCLEILTLGPDTVLERLKDMHAIEEFKVLGTNPRILRLVHYQNKARLRLEYLNQLRVRCASLHILSGGSEKFAKFARDGTDRTKGRDIVVFLANILENDENSIRQLLSRHPNWCHIPLLQVKQCLDFLLSKKFTLPAINNNIHLLLYPIERIQEKLMLLYDQQSLKELQLPIDNINDVENSEMLTLILYLIECEYHFTGDGIWTEQQIHTVENFNNLLPDFPESLNKIYKYGMKPSASSNAKVKKPRVLSAKS